MQIGEPLAVLLALLSSAVPKPKYRLHLDADRDGKVDDDWAGATAWQWGRKKRGALFLCNNDDDDAAHTKDNDDDKVNGGNDKDEVAPVVLRRTGPAPPGSWVGYLEVPRGVEKFVRIFDKRAGGNEIIGPAMGPLYILPDLNFTEVEYGIEALRFAGTGFNGQALVTFRIEDGSALIYSQVGRLRVAPWIMPNHLDPAVKVFVVDAGAGNARFRTELGPFVAGAGCSLQQYADRDIWMQDCMEIGVCSSATKAAPVVMRAKRGRPLKAFPRTLLAPDFGYEEVAPLNAPGVDDSTFDSTGNLEVTPPLMTGTKRQYPWGRIYYGPGRRLEPFDRDTAAFLTAQTVQAPFPVNTNWLTVGHVDEVISFVPAPGGRGFKLLLASPQRAYAILDAANKSAAASEHLLVGREFPEFNATGFVGMKNAEVSIRGFLTTGIPSLGFDGPTLRRFNKQVAAHMTGIRKTFKANIASIASEIIEVPILYFPNEADPSWADALTGGMVNMLVINKHCIIPKPFGPVVAGVDLFEQDLSAQLAALGLTLHFIDDWHEYHVNLGEVHCGTNTVRKPSAPARWWEFAG